MKMFLIIALLFCSACSGVKMLSADRNVAESTDTSKLYTQEFLQKISVAKEKFRQGKADLALQDLNSMNQKSLLPSEAATQLNLIGVIKFSQKKYAEAEKNFELATNSSKEDPTLESQVYLNLGSAQYKMNQQDKALNALSLVDYRLLPDGEAKKFHRLHGVLAEHLGKRDISFSSMIRLLADKKTMGEIRSESRFQKTKDLFRDVSPSEKVRKLEEFDGERNMAVAALAAQEGEAANQAGDHARAEDYANWIEKRYSDNPEMMKVASNLKNGTNNSSIDIYYIGVILPLTGERKSLGERALNGIDLALEELSQDPNKKFRLEIKDTQSNPALAAFGVRDLIEQNNVAAIIGGLTPGTATKEYLEAKKHGVLFISLSPVYLPKEEKNHLLIEIPGSIESQVDQVFSQKMLNKLGTRPAIIYPKNELGEAYANEFWRRAKQLKLEVTGVVSFDKNASDFRDPVKNLLGIKYTREREEEVAIVNEISNLEKHKNIKRLQSLQPQVDFDWIFVPALPKDVVQLLPNFNFFDAFNINYVGVPSWRSELMSNEGYRYGNVYFVDEQTDGDETVFTQNFNKKFNHQPKIVETISYDAIKIFASIQIPANQQVKRQTLEMALEKQSTLQGESGTWRLNDGIWLKQLSGFKIKRDGVEAL